MSDVRVAIKRSILLWEKKKYQQKIKYMYKIRQKRKKTKWVSERINVSHFIKIENTKMGFQKTINLMTPQRGYFFVSFKIISLHTRNFDIFLLSLSIFF